MATILVADDEKSVQNLLKVLLESERYSVIIARNGIDAVALAKSVQPNCAIVDLMLPPTEGITVSENLKKLAGCEKLPIIIYTGRNDIPQKRQEKLAERFGAFLEKPADTATLLLTIKKLLTPI